MAGLLEWKTPVLEMRRSPFYSRELLPLLDEKLVNKITVYSSEGYLQDLFLSSLESSLRDPEF